MVAAIVAYLRLYMPLKRRMIPGSRRKLLIDLTVFVAPVYAGLCWLGGLGPAAATDVLAFVVAAGIIVLRSGCFLAGCYHGVPSRVGARYPGCDERVVPLPLFEVFVGVVLMGTAVGMMIGGAPAGTIFAPVIGTYTGYRFCSEFLRARAGRFAVHRALSLTMTQLLCAIIVVGLVLIPRLP